MRFEMKFGTKFEKFVFWFFCAYLLGGVLLWFLSALSAQNYQQSAFDSLLGLLGVVFTCASLLVLIFFFLYGPILLLRGVRQPLSSWPAKIIKIAVYVVSAIVAVWTFGTIAWFALALFGH